MGKKPVADLTIRNFTRKLAKRIHLTKAILFGSRASNTHLKHSDYDVILVSPDFQGIHFTERASEVLRKVEKHFPLDLLCYTPKEFNEKKKQICIVRKAVREGIEII